MTDDDSHARAVDNAWKIHAAVAEWTRGVDSKASFVLTIEVAILAGVVNLMGGGHRLAHVHGPCANALLYTGIGGLVVAVVLVTWVMRPRTRNRRVLQEAPSNFVYFGHLNFRLAEGLESSLRNDDILPVLCRQLVVTGRIAWDKHNLLKWSLTTAMLGAVFVCAAAGLA